jgi:hypothetical protein
LHVAGSQRPALKRNDGRGFLGSNYECPLFAGVRGSSATVQYVCAGLPAVLSHGETLAEPKKPLGCITVFQPVLGAVSERR